MRDWEMSIVKVRCSEAFRARCLYNMRRARAAALCYKLVSIDT